DAKTALTKLREKVPSLKIIAIEQSSKSIDYDKADYTFPIALIVGHETHGVSKEVLAMSDQIVEIPMWGVNKSLNVMVSLGIVLYKAMGDIVE
ncbi:MAG: TrmH family RNA methyltransferase, partial [Patescibacteria group bacterium]